MFFSDAPRIWCARLYGAIESTCVKHSVFWRKVMQISYRLDFAIIHFSACDKLLLLHLNTPVCSTIKSTTIKRPSFVSPKTAKKSLFFINWRTKTPQKFRSTPNFNKHVNLHQHTTRCNLPPSSDCLMCLFEYLWEIVEKRSFFNVVFCRPESFDMQSYLEDVRGLVSKINFLKPKVMQTF